MHHTHGRDGRSPAGHGRGAPRGAVLAAALAAAVSLIGVGGASGAAASGSAQGPPPAPTAPPFSQCPPIGIDSGCQFLVDVTPSGPKVTQDVSQPYYEGHGDMTVGIQNDSGAPVASVHLGVAGSGDETFNFDGDGLCSVTPAPAGCPFGPPGNNADPFDYFGPDAALVADPGTTDSGSVVFATPLAPGQYTYVSLEGPPTANAYLSAGAANDVVTSSLADTADARVRGPVIATSTPADVTDTAAIGGANARFADGEVTYRVFSDPACTTEVAFAGTRRVVAGVAKPSEPVGARLASNARYYWLIEYSGNGGPHPNAPAASACGNEVMTFGAAPRSDFTLIGRPRVNRRTGQIVVIASFPTAGVATAAATIARARRAGSRARSAAAKTCELGFVLRRGRCVFNGPPVFGTARRSIPGAHRYSLRIDPTTSTRRALRSGRGLHVIVSITFQNRAGGAPVTRVRGVTVKLRGRGQR